MKITLEISFSFKHELDDPQLTLALPEGTDILAALHSLGTHTFVHACSPRVERYTGTSTRSSTEGTHRSSRAFTRPFGMAIT